MLHVHCDRLGQEVMIWSPSVLGVSNTDMGIVVTYKCACGEMAQMLTGAAAPGEISQHVSV